MVLCALLPLTPDEQGITPYAPGPMSLIQEWDGWVAWDCFEVIFRVGASTSFAKQNWDSTFPFRGVFGHVVPALMCRVLVVPQSKKRATSYLAHRIVSNMGGSVSIDQTAELIAFHCCFRFRDRDSSVP